MIALHRARVFLVCAVVVALIMVGVEFPFSELVHQRGQLALLNSQLSAMQARNDAVSIDIASLKKPSTIEAIAHEDYGLVEPGQISYAILPGPNSSKGSGSLGQAAVPVEDLVAAPPVASSNATIAANQPQSSFFSRLAARLEFWR